MKMQKPAIDNAMKAKAKKYGYHKKYAELIGEVQEKNKKGRAPVAKDTNKTRRKMVKPTKGRGSY